jgi:hypothetical protein
MNLRTRFHKPRNTSKSRAATPSESAQIGSISIRRIETSVGGIPYGLEAVVERWSAKAKRGGRFLWIKGGKMFSCPDHGVAA